MAVVINEFEVVPEAPKTDASAAKNQGEKGGAPASMPTDHEIKQMLERRTERLERVSTY
jgi:hypothetical protein